jgi:hypothetical protein
MHCIQVFYIICWLNSEFKIPIFTRFFRTYDSRWHLEKDACGNPVPKILFAYHLECTKAKICIIYLTSLNLS